MKRTIIVKGVGTLKTKPDRVKLTLTLEARNKDYETAMRLSDKQIADLGAALVEAGFDKNELKTTNFNVHTNYEGVHDERGNYRTVFDCYICMHDLTLTFDYDNALISKALSAIAKCEADPQLNIAFTVKDPASIKDRLLNYAAENARKKAEILCAASGVQLGQLININYNWGDVNVYSNTRFMNAKNTVANECYGAQLAFDASMLPEDIVSQDSVNFTWEII